MASVVIVRTNSSDVVVASATTEVTIVKRG